MRALRTKRYQPEASAAGASAAGTSGWSKYEITRRGSVALPIDALGVGPEVLQAVVFAGVGVEDVDDDVAVVLHHPLGGRVAFDAEAGVALLVHLGVDLLRQGVDLAAAGTGREDEEVV